MFRARVLVIDDDPSFRSLVTSMLRKDCFVSIASEGAEGYFKALEHPPELVVADIKLPGWDGLRTLKAFRAHQLLSNIPFVILTADASKETVLAAIHAGANDYVIKTSFAKLEFLSKIRKLLQNTTENLVATPLRQSNSSTIHPPHAIAPTEVATQRGLQSTVDAWE